VKQLPFFKTFLNPFSQKFSSIQNEEAKKQLLEHIVGHMIAI
jgi:hypothetical protein